MSSISALNKTLNEEKMKFHDELNPAIWEGNKLKEKVAMKLMEIASNFVAYLDTNGFTIDDIIITGSMANYNYTDQSDIDLHIICDYDKLPTNCPILSQEYFQAKKKIYNDKHNIKIYGYDVELYVEDKSAPSLAGGKYSLLKREWLRFPQKIDFEVEDVVGTEELMDLITQIENVCMTDGNIQEAEELLNHIYEMRKSGLAQNGEFSFENLIFKALRNRGYLDKLRSYIAYAEDLSLSLNESVEKLTSNENVIYINSASQAAQFIKSQKKDFRGLAIDDKSGYYFSPYDETTKYNHFSMILAAYKDGLLGNMIDVPEFSNDFGGNYKKNQYVNDSLTELLGDSYPFIVAFDDIQEEADEDGYTLYYDYGDFRVYDRFEAFKYLPLYKALGDSKSYDMNNNPLNETKELNESVEYIDDIEILINPTKQELQGFMKKNKVYRVLLTDNDMAIWTADCSICHNEVQSYHPEFRNSEHLFALNGNLFFVDYDMQPEEIEDFYFEDAEKLDNLPIVKKYFPQSQMKKALDMMKNGISMFNAPSDWYGWLGESYLTEGIAEIAKKQFPKMPEEKLRKFVALDPTYKGGDQLGKYGQWIIRLFYNNIKNAERMADYKEFYEKNNGINPKTGQVIQKPDLLPQTPYEDADKIPNLLKQYEVLKKEIGKPIDSFKTIPDLYTAIQQHTQKGVPQDKEALERYNVFKACEPKGLKKIYEDNNWIIGIPTTFESSKPFGEYTNWCTTSHGGSYYDKYLNQYGGEYYILLDKTDGALYQFHFESNQFMDEGDHQIDMYGFTKDYPNIAKFLYDYKMENSSPEMAKNKLAEKFAEIIKDPERIKKEILYENYTSDVAFEGDNVTGFFNLKYLSAYVYYNTSRSGMNLETVCGLLTDFYDNFSFGDYSLRDYSYQSGDWKEIAQKYGVNLTWQDLCDVYDGEDSAVEDLENFGELQALIQDDFYDDYGLLGFLQTCSEYGTQNECETDILSSLSDNLPIYDNTINLDKDGEVIAKFAVSKQDLWKIYYIMNKRSDDIPEYGKEIKIEKTEKPEMKDDWFEFWGSKEDDYYGYDVAAFDDWLYCWRVATGKCDVEDFNNGSFVIDEPYYGWSGFDDKYFEEGCESAAKRIAEILGVNEKKAVGESFTKAKEEPKNLNESTINDKIFYTKQLSNMLNICMNIGNARFIYIPEANLYVMGDAYNNTHISLFISVLDDGKFDIGENDVDEYFDEYINNAEDTGAIITKEYANDENVWLESPDTTNVIYDYGKFYLCNGLCIKDSLAELTNFVPKYVKRISYLDESIIYAENKDLSDIILQNPTRKELRDNKMDFCRVIIDEGNFYFGLANYYDHTAMADNLLTKGIECSIEYCGSLFYSVSKNTWLCREDWETDEEYKEYKNNVYSWLSNISYIKDNFPNFKLDLIKEEDYDIYESQNLNEEIVYATKKDLSDIILKNPNRKEILEYDNPALKHQDWRIAKDNNGNYYFGSGYDWVHFEMCDALKKQGIDIDVVFADYDGVASYDSKTNTFYIRDEYGEPEVIEQEFNNSYLKKAFPNAKLEIDAEYDEMLESKQLNESWSDVDDFLDIQEETRPYDVLMMYKSGENNIWYPLIKPTEYKQALNEFMKYGEIVRYPEDKIYNWLKIIFKNTCLIDSITQLAGHTEWFPYEDVKEAYEEAEDLPEKYSSFQPFLEEQGFYDWCKLPDGSDAWSDYGLKPLYNILNEYNDNMNAGQVLVLINRCLDVYHQRGDLASAFIDGGNASLTKISNESKLIKGNQLNESIMFNDEVYDDFQEEYRQLTVWVNPSIDWIRNKLNESGGFRFLHSIDKNKLYVFTVKSGFMHQQVFDMLDFDWSKDGRNVVGVFNPDNSISIWEALADDGEASSSLKLAEKLDGDLFKQIYPNGYELTICY